MCGIVGITSTKNVSNSILNSLRKLEYRGYDSAGIAVLNECINMNNNINSKDNNNRFSKFVWRLFKHDLKRRKLIYYSYFSNQCLH